MNETSLIDIINRYQQAIIINPNDAHAHHHLAMYYSQQNNYSSALKHFNAALKSAPNFLLAHYHAGLLLLKHQDWEMAKIRFLSVLDLENNHIQAHFYLGSIFLQEDQLDQAEEHFNFILTINPDHVQTLINFGALALKRNAGQIAINYFTQALALDNNNLEARRNLAATFLHFDRFENALTHYDELQKIAVLETEDYYNMGVITMMLGKFSEAINYYKKTITQEPNHSAALNNLATIYIRLGKRAEAIPFLQRAVQINPNNSSGQFMLNVLQKNHAQPEESQEYVKNLFDHYAFNFDHHLQKILKYSLPEQSIELLRLLHKNKFQQALDLGCGTGLSGATLRDYCVQLTGVDLSAKMLEQARIKKCYDHLIKSDIVAYLQNNQQQYDLIQALDVLPYFGDLKMLFSLIVKNLANNGLLVFSMEISDTQAWLVQDSMRFCHHPDYIQSVLDNYPMRLLHHSKVIARQENEQNLHAMIMIYKKHE